MNTQQPFKEPQDSPIDLLALLGRQVLSVLVIDLEYGSAPLHGHAPIRHQLLWGWACKALGDKADAEVESLLEARKSGECRPIKTNPLVGPDYSNPAYDE